MRLAAALLAGVVVALGAASCGEKREANGAGTGPATVPTAPPPTSSP